MKYSLSLKQVLDCVGEHEQEGSGCNKVQGIASLNQAIRTDLSFLGNSKYRNQVAESDAGVLLIPKDYEGHPKPNQVFIRVDNPSWGLAKICRYIESSFSPRPQPGIHPSSVVDPEAKVSSEAYIGPFCHIESGAEIQAGVILSGYNYIGKECQIGENTYLFQRATVLNYCQIGKRVVLQTGAVIGSEGFGFETKNGVHEKVPQIGGVTIEDDVDIGANTTIDRARFDQTRIGAGSKIDNLVQIAHNVTIGRGCIIAAQVGVSGSTHIEDYVVIGGQAGLAGHIHIGKGSKIGAQSGIPGNLSPGSFVRGSPAEPYFQEQRILVLRRKLPEFFKRLSTLEEQMKNISSPQP